MGGNEPRVPGCGARISIMTNPDFREYQGDPEAD
jgi:hypothetical protein